MATFKVYGQREENGESVNIKVQAETPEEAEVIARHRRIKVGRVVEVETEGAGGAAVMPPGIPMEAPPVAPPVSTDPPPVASVGAPPPVAGSEPPLVELLPPVVVAPPMAASAAGAPVGVPRAVPQMPAEEKVLWEGRPSFVYHLQGMIWTALWLALWIVLALMRDTMAEWAFRGILKLPPQVLDTEFVRKVAVNLEWVWVPFAVLAGISLLKLLLRLLRYVNTYFIVTNQRLRIQQGTLMRQFHQIELYRLKNTVIWEPLMGRMFGYAHVRFVSSDPIVGDCVWFGVQGGTRAADEIRKVAQMAQAQMGILNVQG